MPVDLSLCACNSGLRRLRCCGLDLNLLSPPEANRTLGTALNNAREAARNGRNAEAIEQCRELLELSPGWVEALMLLVALIRAERPRAAEVLLRRVLAIEPNHLLAALDLAASFLNRSVLGDAEFYARNAVRLAPENPRAHNLLGMILTQANRARSGEYHYRRVLELTHSDDPAVLANLASNLKDQGRIEEARVLYQSSLTAAPANLHALLGAARLEEVDRKVDAAEALLDRAEEAAPGDARVALIRAVCAARRGQQHQALDLINGLAAKRGGDTPALDAGELSEKGRILDRMERFDEAWAAFDQAKRQLRERGGHTYLDQVAGDMVRRLTGFFTERRLATLPRATTVTGRPQPIFIVGFPRSGTTLLEQCLTAHPRIAAGDELPFVWEIAHSLPRQLESQLTYPEALAELWMGDKRGALDRLRDLYLARVADQGILSPQSSWFTDKMPLNETHLGLIGLLFPEAPIIHLIRHPLDVVVSVFSNHLSHGYHCASALETVATHFARVADLVAHYRSEMTLRYLPLRYEDLVGDQERSLRRAFDFIGEDFDPRCLAFTENARYARTASYAQVTEPIYDRSVFRYRHYLEGLKPIIPVLEPIIQRLGYTVAPAPGAQDLTEQAA
jgi:Flp pilus assembly protein TadD